MHHETGDQCCGVAMTLPVGDNDGSVKGHKYFEVKTAQNQDKYHGILCNPSQVSKIATAPPQSTRNVILVCVGGFLFFVVSTAVGVYLGLQTV